MSLSLEIDVEHGWLMADLNVGTEVLRWRASYLSDAVYDLLASTTAALSKQPAEVVFVDEPGCTVLNLMPTEDGMLILSFGQHDKWPMHDQLSSSPNSEFKVRQRTFAGAVASAVQSLEADQNGLDYQGRWHHPFPAGALALLTATLRDRARSV